MDHICLAAGRGTRFGRLGAYLQKCMYPVGLRPFLEYTVRDLRRARHLDPERDRLAVVVGHHAEQPRAYFGDRFEGLELVWVEQAEPLGTGHALRLAADALEPAESAVAWLADLRVPTALFDRLVAHPGADVVTLAASPEGGDAAVRATVRGERVERAWRGEGPLFDIGLWKLSPATLAAMGGEGEGGSGRTAGEARALQGLQRRLDAGLELGWIEADEWLHLGGTRPTAEEAALRVARRVLEIEREREAS